MKLYIKHSGYVSLAFLIFMLMGCSGAGDKLKKGLVNTSSGLYVCSKEILSCPFPLVHIRGQGQRRGIAVLLAYRRIISDIEFNTVGDGADAHVVAEYPTQGEGDTYAHRHITGVSAVHQKSERVLELSFEIEDIVTNKIKKYSHTYYKVPERKFMRTANKVHHLFVKTYPPKPSKTKGFQTKGDNKRGLNIFIKRATGKVFKAEVYSGSFGPEFDPIDLKYTFSNRTYTSINEDKIKAIVRLNLSNLIGQRKVKFADYDETDWDKILSDKDAIEDFSSKDLTSLKQKIETALDKGLVEKLVQLYTKFFHDILSNTFHVVHSDSAEKDEFVKDAFKFYKQDEKLKDMTILLGYLSQTNLAENKLTAGVFVAPNTAGIKLLDTPKVRVTSKGKVVEITAILKDVTGLSFLMKAVSQKILKTPYFLFVGHHNVLVDPAKRRLGAQILVHELKHYLDYVEDKSRFSQAKRKEELKGLQPKPQLIVKVLKGYEKSLEFKQNTEVTFELNRLKDGNQSLQEIENDYKGKFKALFVKMHTYLNSSVEKDAFREQIRYLKRSKGMSLEEVFEDFKLLQGQDSVYYEELKKALVVGLAPFFKDYIKALYNAV